MNRLRGWARRHRSGLCSCGCPGDAHEHWRPGSDCGACGWWRCLRFNPVDLAAVDRDNEVIEAVRVGDVDKAREIAGPEFVGLVRCLVALKGGR